MLPSVAPPPVLSQDGLINEMQMNIFTNTPQGQDQGELREFLIVGIPT